MTDAEAIAQAYQHARAAADLIDAAYKEVRAALAVLVASPGYQLTVSLDLAHGDRHAESITLPHWVHGALRCDWENLGFFEVADALRAEVVMDHEAEMREYIRKESRGRVA
jgi:hypothetical protein